MVKNKNLLWLTRNGILAAMYVALTLVFAPISYGALQFRVSELLVMMPFFNKKWIAGITIGCAIANMFSPLGIVDVVFGTLATFIAGVLVSKVKNIYVASLFPALVNGVIIGIQLHIIYQLPLLINMIYVAVGEFAVVFISAVLLKQLSKNPRLSKVFDD